MPCDEQFRTLYCDPGEDFGWCQGVGLQLISGGTEKMWVMADNVWAALNDPLDQSNDLNSPDFLRDGVDPELLKLPIGRIVYENFRIYPWKAKELAWDEVRTARVIGAIIFMARLLDIPIHKQGANIKAAAQAAGAEELYWRPLRENRHQNDAIQHFVFWTNVELMGVNLPVPADV